MTPFFVKMTWKLRQEKARGCHLPDRTPNSVWTHFHLLNLRMWSLWYIAEVFTSESDLRMSLVFYVGFYLAESRLLVNSYIKWSSHSSQVVRAQATETRTEGLSDDALEGAGAGAGEEVQSPANSPPKKVSKFKNSYTLGTDWSWLPLGRVG